MFKPLTAVLAFCFFAASGSLASAKDFLMIELKSGTVKIELLDEIAPNHVARVKTLAESGAYDGIAFHRVIDGFMAQTGDVQFGQTDESGEVSAQAGYGGSDMPDLKQEFSDIPFERGIVGAARGGHSVDSANSQFFIMFVRYPSLDGKYTVWGQVTEGIEHVDNISLTQDARGQLSGPRDRMIRAWIESE